MKAAGSTRGCPIAMQLKPFMQIYANLCKSKSTLQSRLAIGGAHKLRSFNILAPTETSSSTSLTVSAGPEPQDFTLHTHARIKSEQMGRISAKLRASLT